MNLFTWTGNPFADTGLSAILAHSRKKQPEDLTLDDVNSLNKMLLQLYLTPEWLKAMQNIFPNGALTNPAFSKTRATVWKGVLDFLTDELKPAQEAGSCICCGQRDAVRLPASDKRKLANNMVFSKVYVPLNGGVPNFFPGGQMGADFCANCVYAIQCAPLNLYTANCDEKRFLAVHSNSPDILLDYAREAAKDVNVQLSTGQFSGPFNQGYRNAHNAFFHLVDLILSERDWDEDDRYASIALYHFDNYNQPKLKPLQIYSMPALVFRFLIEVKNVGLLYDWQQLVRRNYYFTKNKKKIPLALGDDKAEERKSKSNLVHENLLADVSIVSRFISRRSRRVNAPWPLLALYLKEVRSMKNQRLETIKRVGDDLADLIRNVNKNRLGDLERAANYNSFRNVLRLCVKDRLRANALTPLFSYEEYVEQLFPEGNLGWRETQDLLLFRIYEQLHDFLKKEPDIVPADKEPDEALETADTETDELEPAVA